MRSRHASSAARAYEPMPWRESRSIVIDLQARRLSPAAQPAEHAPEPNEPYSWDDFETANTNAPPPPRSRDLGSRRTRVKDMSVETRLMICLFAILFLFAAPAPMSPQAKPPVKESGLAGRVHP